MPDLSTAQLTSALAIVAGVAVLSLLVTLVLVLRLKKLRHQYAIVRGDGEARDIIEIVQRSMTQMKGMERRMDSLAADLRAQLALNRLALQKFALVRYDAFEEMGGQLSFSAAFLDDHGDGIIITSINGRTETRTYAKPIKRLSSRHNLSEEEQEAITKAAASEVRVAVTSR